MPSPGSADVGSEILRLPEIPPLPQEILEAVNQHHLVVFVGSGPSCIMGYPTWTGLAGKVVDACRDDIASLDHPSDTLSENFWAYCSDLASKNPKKALSICHQLFKEKNAEERSLTLAARCHDPQVGEGPHCLQCERGKSCDHIGETV